MLIFLKIQLQKWGMTQEYLIAIQDFDELKLAVRQVNYIDQLSLSLFYSVLTI